MYDKLNKIFKWIYSLLVLNFLWIIFTLRGIIVAGIFPATSAMCAVLRKLVRGEEVFIYKEYKRFYEKDFKNSNILGYVLSVIGYILFVDYTYFSSGNTILDLYMSYLIMLLMIFYVVSFVFMFTIYNHYEFKLLGVLKYSLLFPVSNLLSTCVVIISILAVIVCLNSISSLCVLLLGVSATGAVGVYLSSLIFERYDKKTKTKINESVLYEVMY